MVRQTKQHISWVKWNKPLAAIVVVQNLICFYGLSGYIIYTVGGPMGFGILALPVALLANIVSIPAWQTLLRKQPGQRYLILNFFSVVWCTAWFTMFIMLWSF